MSLFYKVFKPIIVIGGLTLGYGVEVIEKWFGVKDVGNIAPVDRFSMSNGKRKVTKK